MHSGFALNECKKSDHILLKIQEMMVGCIRGNQKNIFPIYLKFTIERSNKSTRLSQRRKLDFQ